MPVAAQNRITREFRRRPLCHGYSRRQLLAKRRHRGLARRLVAVPPRVVLVVPES